MKLFVKEFCRRCFRPATPPEASLRGRATVALRDYSDVYETCMCVYVCIYIQRIHICECMHAMHHRHMCIYIYIHIHIHLHLQLQLHLHTHIHIDIDIYVYIYIFIYYIHTRETQDSCDYTGIAEHWPASCIVPVPMFGGDIGTMGSAVIVVLLRLNTCPASGCSRSRMARAV